MFYSLCSQCFFSQLVESDTRHQLQEHRYTGSYILHHRDHQTWLNTDINAHSSTHHCTWILVKFSDGQKWVILLVCSGPQKTWEHCVCTSSEHLAWVWQAVHCLHFSSFLQLEAGFILQYRGATESWLLINRPPNDCWLWVRPSWARGTHASSRLFYGSTKSIHVCS